MIYSLKKFHDFPRTCDEGFVDEATVQLRASHARARLAARMREAKSCAYGPNLCLYSVESMKAFTISAFTKLPSNWLSLLSQKS